MDWARILAFVTGMVDQELLARNEYLAAENRILKAQLKGRLKLSDAERATLGEIGHDWAARFSARWRMWPGRSLDHINAPLPRRACDTVITVARGPTGQQTRAERTMGTPTEHERCSPSLS
jgi:hypothetical protein